MSSAPQEAKRGRASLVQEWFLLAQATNPSAPPLHCHSAYRVRGNLDLDRLREAAQDVVDCHPALRTRFDLDGEVALQSVLPAATIELVKEGRPIEFEEGVRLLEREASRPFNRQQPPLGRLVVVETTGGDYLVSLVVDHLVADGYSFDILLADLSAAYRQRGRERVAELDPAGPYLTYAAEQRERFDQGRKRELAAYWRNQLGGSRDSFGVKLPGYRSCKELTGSSIIRISLPREMLDGLEETSESLRTTKFCLGLAAVQALVATLTERRRVTVLTSCANRFDPRYERTVGWFANGVFPTVEVDSSMPGRVLIERAEDAVLGAMEHGDMPSWHVRREIWPELPEGLRREPGVYFMYRLVDGAELDLDGARLETIDLDEEVDTPGIQFWLLERAGTLELEVFHYASEYSRGDAEWLAGAFVSALESLLDESGEPLNQTHLFKYKGGKVHV